MVEVSLSTEPARTVYALRNIGPYRGIGSAFERLERHCEDNGQRVRAALGVFCDNPAKIDEGELVSYACLEVEGDLIPAEDIEVRPLPGGPVAKAVARGPYGGQAVQEAYDAVYTWIREGGKYEALDLGDRTPFETTCREVYPNDPAETPPERLLTEIQVPVRIREE